jgi:hypothetical protein
MAAPTPKELKRLAKACRDAGIKHYKCADFEFTLSDDPPEPRRQAGQPQASGPDGPFKTDSLTPEQLLFFSVRDEADIIGPGEKSS